MNYKIAEYTLFTNDGKLVSDECEQLIRPKTLQLLMFFLEHPRDIYSKQTLLDKVWNSAGAQEHVLFQSINEIRKLFKSLTVVKTFPQKGYQWVHEASEINNEVNVDSNDISTPTNSNIDQRTLSIKWAAILLVVLIAFFVLGGTLITHYLADTTNDKHINEQSILPSREIVVLPIDNKIVDSQHDWVRLGAMDVVIQKLKSQGKFAVLDVEDVMMALARGDGFELSNFEQLSRTLRSQLGEIVTIHSKLIGAPMNYQLHYSLVGRYQIKQGIVFADELDEIWDKLLVEVMDHYQTPYNEMESRLAQQMADYQFLQAMEQFYMGANEIANQHFSLLLHSQPDNLTARRFYLKSLIRAKEYTLAQEVGEHALEIALQRDDVREHLRFLFELGVLASEQQQFAKANTLFEQSRTLAKKHSDNLYVAFSHSEIGHILTKQNQWSQAEIMYQQALTYHQGFKCPYGQIQNLDALANVAFAQNDKIQATKHFDSALVIANKNDLLFEQIWLLLNNVNRTEALVQKNALITESESLVKRLENSEIKTHFTARISHVKKEFDLDIN